MLAADNDEQEPIISTISPVVARRSKGDVTNTALPSVNEVLRRPGRPLNPAVRSYMENRFGQGFGQVRIHTDQRGAKSAWEMNARAYTVGSDVVFGPGEYNPGTKSGRQLLAHELTHTVQQTQDRSRIVQRAGPDVGTVTTPPFLPEPAPPGTIPPSHDEEKVDGEGNRIAQAAGRPGWYLDEEPDNLNFPIATGYKYQLLPINPNASYYALKTRIEQVRDEQLAYAERLKGDMKYWFPKVYYYVTKFELEAIESGTYKYPHMKMQEIIQFHATYKSNIDDWITGQKDEVEANWREAFEAAESVNDGNWWRSRGFEINRGLIPSVEAHIRFDLPRAIAAAYEIHYSGIPGASLDEFKSDFNAMEDVFQRATEAMNPEIEEETGWYNLGEYERIREGGLPLFFSIDPEREMAWKKAELITKYRSTGLEAVDEVVRATLTAMHPNFGAFEVGHSLWQDDEEDVKDYDWLSQPGARQDSPGPEPIPKRAPDLPEFPERLYFRFNRPRDTVNLEDAVRRDQDLAPLLRLAEWTRLVRDAEIVLEGHASSEGAEVNNYNLASARAELVEYFLFRVGADSDNNRIVTESEGEEGALPSSEWRYVQISVEGRPVAKQQFTPPNMNLPSEVNLGRIFAK